MMFLIDLRAAADGQISDKYQHYGDDNLLMARPQSIQFHPAEENRLSA
ncbi:hypothetical protein [Mesorhizobium sp. M2C.T.Ca.TU.002.02.1.1]|nr:hypothetical protein [Mesorhizobium sp. M2C.T.Ca.TU.002.02.1.1]